MTVSRIDQLAIINAEIETANESRFATLSEKRKALSVAFSKAIALRDAIDVHEPESWDEAPDPFSVPNQPMKWFLAALREANSRNARRMLIKQRLMELRRDLQHYKDSVRQNRINQQRRKLVAEAWDLGPVEPTERGDKSATNYLKLLAWNMREDAESKALSDGACVECGNLAQPAHYLCHDCGTFDVESDAEAREREEAIADPDSEPELVTYVDGINYGYDATEMA